MKADVELQIPVGTFMSMTDEQITSLRVFVLADGVLGRTSRTAVRIDGFGDYVGVHLPGIFIGIEKDGYTDS